MPLVFPEKKPASKPPSATIGSLLPEKSPAAPVTVPPRFMFPLTVRLPVNVLLDAPSCGTTEVLMEMVPDVVIVPPVKPSPVATLVTVPVAGLTHAHAPLTNSRIWLAPQLLRPRLVLPPKETAPPPFSGLLAVTVKDECASIALVTPVLAMLNVPLCVIGPPVSPAPLATLVTVPVPGKVWPAMKVTLPVLLTSKVVP